MYQLSANLEWLFPDAGDTAGRIRAAAAHGLSAVEIWTWRDKDLHLVEQALHETGTVLQTMCTEPMGRLVDPSTHGAFLDGLHDSLEVAQQLGSPYLVVTAGDTRQDIPACEQRAAVVEALQNAGALLAGTGTTLLLENLNSRADHVGTFLDDTTQVVSILRDVASPNVRLLFDAYHSQVMGEDTQQVLSGAVDLLGHVQVADAPGRHEPGSGTVDWSAELAALRRLGYAGRIGLEYQPSTATAASLLVIEQIAATA